MHGAQQSDSKILNRMRELSQNAYRPKAILDLAEDIEGEKRVAALRTSITGRIDHEHLEQIVKMMRKLDKLFSDWAFSDLE